MLGLARATQCRAPTPAVRRAGVAGLPGSIRPSRVSSGSRLLLRATAETKAEAKSKKAKADEEDEEEEEEPVFEDGPEVAPSTAQVQAFLNTLCGETSVAQVELKLGSFSLKVRRSIESAAPPPPPAPVPVYAAPAPEPVTIVTSGGGGALATESIDEALVYVTAPKVGVFRRGKYAAGKRIGKGDMIKEGDVLRQGQAIAFVEQLGTFVEVKSPHAGEAVKFRVKEGEPVEYGQIVLELAPTFGLASPAT